MIDIHIPPAALDTGAEFLDSMEAWVTGSLVFKREHRDRLFALARRGAEAAARIERLEAALRFYAGWPQGPAGNIAPFLMDAGHKARAALEGK